MLLLDLNLGDSDGMTLLESKVAGSFHTIIVSATTDQALRAFEHGVLDFVPKPFAEERLNQLNASLPKLQADVDGLRVTDVSSEEVLAEATALYDRWPLMTTDEKRRIVESLIEKVVIGDGKIDITFSYLPTSEEQCKSQQQL